MHPLSGTIKCGERPYHCSIQHDYKPHQGDDGAGGTGAAGKAAAAVHHTERQ